ncbi:chromodomain-helicase-DNA-binding protein 1-like isoform X1 [Solanum tuberosum]|nr:PREDICTED: chromodomain-helicase-DNA-binding protein 1-like isoform X1 [Solanum tuberosum]
MNFEQRLIAAAKFVYTGDSVADDPPVNSVDLGVKATLKPHQVEGVSWLVRRYLLGVNVILGDEMGLGKTLQAISLLSYLKVYLKTPGPFLVLCPLSVTDGWMSEMANFAPKLRVLTYTGEKEHRRNLRRKIYECMNREASDAKSLPFDVLLTTYDIVLLDEDFLSQVPWCYAIIDEAQRLKNPSSVLYNVLKERFVMPRKLLMTGTPIQNNLSELWALLHFCMPSVFGTLEQFLSAFKEAGDPSCPDADKAKEQFKILKYVIGAFMLRRTKSQLIELGTLVLPPLTEITVMAPLVALQKKVYMSILRKELTQLLALASGAPNTRSLQNIVIQLRKACSHPYLFAGIEPEPYEEGEHLVQASGKLLILDHLLQKLHACGHRVLLFSQMTQTLDILQDYLELRKYSYERLDGSIRAEERFAAIRSFSHNRSKFEAEQNAAFVFLISTRAGGVGLNLVAADTVIFYEQDWNPQVDKQALQRAHRIGQTNHVLSINLVTEQSVEEVIMRRAQRKLQLSHNIIGDDVLDQEGKEMAGAEAGDLRSVMLGLHMLDPAEVTNEESDKFDRNELTAMAETIMAFRNEERSARDDKFEVKPANFLNEFNVVTKRGPESIKLDHILDETSYLEWVEKFKEASQINHNPIFELGNRPSLPEEKHLKAEAAKKKAEEEKLSKWETLGYHSLSVKDPVSAPDTDISSDSGAVHFVYGDCTRPSKVSPSEPTIIFSCVDTSGNWGHGGMFDALARLSTSVPAAYERASEFGDLHLGDLHLIEITEDLAKGGDSPHAPQWVALAVVQSYNPRRKVPRGSVSIPDLERCLSKASYSAAQKSASIHMPRIGYQDGSDRSEWYTIERLLRKYAALHGINIFVYYFRRASQS